MGNPVIKKIKNYRKTFIIKIVSENVFYSDEYLTYATFWMVILTGIFLSTRTCNLMTGHARQARNLIYIGYDQETHLLNKVRERPWGSLVLSRDGWGSMSCSLAKTFMRVAGLGLSFRSVLAHGRNERVNWKCFV